MQRMQLKAEGAAQNVVAQVARCTRFFQSVFEAFVSTEDFTVNVVVSDTDAHRISGNDHAFNDCMRIEFHDVAVFARTGLTFVRVANQIFLTWKLPWHEAPLQTGWEACAASATQARLFDGGNHLVLRHTGDARLSVGRHAIFTQNFAHGLVAASGFVIFQAPVVSIQTRHDLRGDMSVVK